MDELIKEKENSANLLREKIEKTERGIWLIKLICGERKKKGKSEEELERLKYQLYLNLKATKELQKNKEKIENM